MYRDANSTAVPTTSNTQTWLPEQLHASPSIKTEGSIPHGSSSPLRRPFPTPSERWLMNAVSDFILSERPPELVLGIFNFLLTIQPEAMAAAVQRSADSAPSGPTATPSTSRWMSSGGEAASQRKVNPQTKGYLEQHHVALTIEMWAEALLRERPQDCLLFSQNLFQAMVPPPRRLNQVIHGLHANSIDRSIDPDRSLRSDDSADANRRNSTGAPSEGDGGQGNDGTPDARKNDEGRGSPGGSPSDRSPLSPSPISFMASMNASSFEPILPLPLKLRPSRPGSPHANASGLPIPTVLVAYFSVYGHAEKLAESVAEGARTGFKKVAPSTSSLNGAVVIRQIPDLYSAAQRHQVQHSTVVQSYPTLTVEDVRNAQGLVLAFPAKFGIPPAPVLALLEELMVRDGLHGPGRDGTPPRNPGRRSGSVQTSPPGHQRDGRSVSRPRDEPQSSLLLGKVAAVAVSTATQHGGQEEAAEAVLGALVSLGCLAIGPSQPLEDSANLTRTVSTVAGGGPLGAGTIAGIHGERDLDAAERVVAEGLGARVAKLVHQLYG